MPEAVIVSAARSPIGRAGKGSMVSIRPDDLTVQIVKAALAKVPELDPADIDDLTPSSSIRPQASLPTRPKCTKSTTTAGISTSVAR